MRLVLLALIALTSPAIAQIELSDQPAIGGATRLDTLKRRIETLQAQDEDRARRAREKDGWQSRHDALVKRVDALTTRRTEMIRDAAPSAVERRWQGTIRPTPAPVEPPPDAGVDAGLSDAGPSDAGVDAAGDGAVAAPPAAPRPREEARLLPVLEVVDEGGYQEGYLTPGVHPAELKALDALVAAVDVAQHRYDTLLHHHWEEQTQLARALKLTRTLADQLETEAAKVDAPSTRAVSLTEVEELAVEAHHANVERSLARQRARQSAEKADELPAVPTTPDDTAARRIAPEAAFAASLERAAAMRLERQRLLREVGVLNAEVNEAVEKAQAAVHAAHLTEKEAAERTWRHREAALESALDRLRISAKDKAVTAAALAQTTARTAPLLRSINERLDALRLSEPNAVLDERDDPLSEARVYRLERAALLEQRLRLRAEVDRDVLRQTMAEHLDAVIRGNPPAEALVVGQADLLDRAASAQRRHDLLVRCDGWRRGRTTTQSAAAADTAHADRKQRALDAYGALAKECMQEEWVLDAQERLARIARHHLTRQARGSRNWFWYGWRGLASLLAAFLVMLVTRWIGRVTHRLARAPESDAPTPSRVKATEPAQITWRARVSKVRGTFALTLYLGLAVSLWFFASALVVEHLWERPVEWSTWLGWVTHPLMTVGGNPVSLWSIVGILMWIVGGLWLARMFQRFLSEGLMDHFAVQRGVRDVVGTLARYLVILLGIIFGLSSAGIPLTALAAVFGVLGIGIGFGLQNIASNFISGFIILVERPFRRGDYIQVGDMVGEVKEIRARATTIETRNAVTVVVPNSEFVTGKVVNWTLGHNERLRTQINVGVAYGSDLQAVTRILLDVARQHADVLGWPGPRVEMIGFGDSSIDFVLHVWTRRLRTLPGLRSDLYLTIERRFREGGIEIPFPVRTVVMAPPADAPPADEQAKAPPDGEPPIDPATP